MHISNFHPSTGERNKLESSHSRTEPSLVSLDFPESWGLLQCLLACSAGMFVRRVYFRSPTAEWRAPDSLLKKANREGFILPIKI